MENIAKRLTIEAPIEKVFEKFLHEFNHWWPKEYTWSQNDLEKIFINPKVNDFCTEIGPDGFRIDWGRVTELKQNEVIAFKWQISAKREPIPNPAKASNVKVSFSSTGKNTAIDFVHFNFENHGEGSAEYQAMMDSEYGWSYILDNFKKYCER